MPKTCFTSPVFVDFICGKHEPSHSCYISHKTHTPTQIKFKCVSGMHTSCHALYNKIQIFTNTNFRSETRFFKLLLKILFVRPGSLIFLKTKLCDFLSCSITVITTETIFIQMSTESPKKKNHCCQSTTNLQSMHLSHRLKLFYSSCRGCRQVNAIYQS